MVFKQSIEGVEKELNVWRSLQLMRALLPIDQVDVLATNHLADLKSKIEFNLLNPVNRINSIQPVERLF